MQSRRSRTFLDDQGRAFRATITPLERTHPGLDRGYNALVFETLDGGWVGSVPMFDTVTLDLIARATLLRCLSEAVRRR